MKKKKRNKKENKKKNGLTGGRTNKVTCRVGSRATNRNRLGWETRQGEEKRQTPLSEVESVA